MGMRPNNPFSSHFPWVIFVSLVPFQQQQNIVSEIKKYKQAYVYSSKIIHYYKDKISYSEKL